MVHADPPPSATHSHTYDERACLQLALALDPAALSPPLKGSSGGSQPYDSHDDCAQRCAAAPAAPLHAMCGTVETLRRWRKDSSSEAARGGSSALDWLSPPKHGEASQARRQT